MRIFLILALSGALGALGCDSESGGTAGTGGGGSGGSGGGDGSTPTITSVSWEAAPGCAQGEQSDVVVTVLATDPDTDVGDLIYSGSVGGCNGPIDAEVSTVSCPNVAPYPGTVIVSDPDGNDSAPVAFDIGVCETDSCTTDPDTCTQ
jgi:hypothetical protein